MGKGSPAVATENRVLPAALVLIAFIGIAISASGILETLWSFSPIACVRCERALAPMGIGIGLGAAACLALLSKRARDFLERHGAVSLLLLAGISTLTVIYVLSGAIWDDELLYLQSAWNIKEGLVPYADFFDHHHVLLSYLLAGVLMLFGDTIGAILVMKIAMLAVYAATTYVVYLISLDVHGKDAALISAALLGTVLLFMKPMIEIRPDGLQALLSLLAVLLALRRKPLQLAMGGLALGAAFLVSQKASFMVLGLLILAGAGLAMRRISVREAAIFFGASAAPVVVFGAYLLTTGTFAEYYVTNWTFNAQFLSSFSPIAAIAPSILQNTLFWGLAIWGVWLLGRRRDAIGGGIAFLAILLLLLSFATRTPFRHYFVLPIALLAICAGPALLETRRWARWLPGLLLIVGSMVPLATIAYEIPEGSVRSFQEGGASLEKIGWVLSITSPGDVVYDQENLFHAFRRTPHYLWYLGGPTVTPNGSATYSVVGTYQYVTGRHLDYDPCAIVRETRPALVSAMPPNDACLQDDYRPSPYPHIYVRKDGLEVN